MHTSIKALLAVLGSSLVFVSLMAQTGNFGKDFTTVLDTPEAPARVVQVQSVSYPASPPPMVIIAMRSVPR